MSDRQVEIFDRDLSKVASLLPNKLRDLTVID